MDQVEYPGQNTEQWLIEKKNDKSFCQRTPKVKVFEHNNEIYKAGGYVSSSGKIIRFEAIPEAISYSDAFDVNDDPIRSLSLKNYENSSRIASVASSINGRFGM